MTLGPNSRRQLSIAEARCSAHETVTADGREEGVAPPVEHVSQALETANRVRRHDALAHHPARESPSQSVAAKRRLLDEQQRVGEDVELLQRPFDPTHDARHAGPRRPRQDHLERRSTISSGASGPPRTHHTAAPMIAGGQNDGGRSKPDALRRRGRRCPAR